jgi:DNA topoisomerase-2
MIDALQKELILLSNKARYIQENLAGTIDLRKKTKEQVSGMLHDKGYDVLNEDADYKYLVKMPMDSVTEENVEKLLKEKGTKEAELETVKSTSVHKMWITELTRLEEMYVEYKEDRDRLMSGNEKSQKQKVVVKKIVKKPSLQIEK